MGGCISTPQRRRGIFGREESSSASDPSREPLLNKVQPDLRQVEDVPNGNRRMASIFHSKPDEFVHARNAILKLAKTSATNPDKVGLIEDQSVILKEDLETYWNSGFNHQLFKDQEWFKQSCAADRNFSIHPWLKIVSILVVCSFTHWEDFPRIFLDVDGRQDSDLPFDNTKLKGDNFLGPTGQMFFDFQSMFCPLVIRERQEPYKLIDGNVKRRLPFIESTVKIGSGSMSIVTREVIAPYHLEYSTPARQSLNHKAKLVACKQISEKDVEQVEFANLRSLRKCLSHHSRIMVNIASFIDEQSRGDPVYLILYDLAAYTLKFFLEKNGAFARRNRSDSAPRGRNGSENPWAGDLILESHNLADALDFLHDRLYINAMISCAHNDLKPDNILVFYPDHPDEEEKYPVGQWKIADFGLSVIKGKRVLTSSTNGVEAVDGGESHLTPHRRARSLSNVSMDTTHRSLSRSVSLITAQRNAGKYLAPEVVTQGESEHDGRSADIWSFGAMFCEILAYSTKMDHGTVLELQQACVKGADDRYYDTSDPKKPLKEGFTRWLDNLVTDSAARNPGNTRWITDSVDLVKRIMVHEPNERPKAEKIRNKLRKIQEAMRKEEGVLHHVPPVEVAGTSTSSPPLDPAVLNFSESPTAMTHLAPAPAITIDHA